jgi:hypothetical protein
MIKLEFVWGSIFKFHERSGFRKNDNFKSRWFHVKVFSHHRFWIVTCENLMFVVFQSNVNTYLNSNLRHITMNKKLIFIKENLWNYYNFMSFLEYNCYIILFYFSIAENWIARDKIIVKNDFMKNLYDHGVLFWKWLLKNIFRWQQFYQSWFRWDGL